MHKLDYKGGYMGITKPYNTTWQNGLEVTIFPNGDVIDKNTGYFVRRGFKPNIFKEPQQVYDIGSNRVLQDFKQNTNQSNDLMIIIGIIGIIAITGVILNGKRRTN